MQGLVSLASHMMHADQTYKGGEPPKIMFLNNVDPQKFHTPLNFFSSPNILTLTISYPQKLMAPKNKRSTKNNDPEKVFDQHFFELQNNLTQKNEWHKKMKDLTNVFDPQIG